MDEKNESKQARDEAVRTELNRRSINHPPDNNPIPLTSKQRQSIKDVLKANCSDSRSYEKALAEIERILANEPEVVVQPEKLDK